MNLFSEILFEEFGNPRFFADTDLEDLPFSPRSVVPTSQRSTERIQKKTLAAAALPLVDHESVGDDTNQTNQDRLGKPHKPGSKKMSKRR